MRGKLPFAILILPISGITPAGAGKTLTLPLPQQLRQDHPRRCGENRLLRLPVVLMPRITPAGAGKTHTPMPHCICPCLGSPPQVRGKLVRKNHRHLPKRITPAGAGKTTHGMSGEWGCWDHPRRCGENIFSFPNSVKQIGSPPQVRGKPPASRRNGRNVRITPAGAGKTHLCS